MSAYLAWIECLTVALGRLFYALIILGLRFVYYLLFVLPFTHRLIDLELNYVRKIFSLLFICRVKVKVRGQRWQTELSRADVCTLLPCQKVPNNYRLNPSTSAFTTNPELF